MTHGAIGIIGASLAGLNAGLELRRQGFAGRLVIAGEERHKPYDRPPLSKEVARGAWGHDEIKLAFDEAELNAEWRLGDPATALDVHARAVTFASGARGHFPGGVVIATGAAPRIIAGCELEGVHVVRTVEDSSGLYRSLAEATGPVVVIGGGFVGQEVAASCRALGLPVTLVEVAAPARHALGEDVAMHLAEIHRRNGVDVRLGVAVAGIEGEGRVTGVRLADGTLLPASVAVVGVGVTPNVGWLEGSGLTLDNGIVCDETCLAAPGVVAAGDVARWPNRRYGEMRRIEQWDNAVRQAVHAARRLLAANGSPEAAIPYAPVPWFWSDQYGLKLQLIGSTFDHDEVRILADPAKADRLLALYRRRDRLNAVFGINSAKRILGFRRMLEHDPTWEAGLAEAGILLTPIA